MRNELRRKVRKHGDAAQMILESATAIGLVKLRAKRFVLEHDVENVAQHFERHDIGLRSHRGGPGIEIHASQFAEEIAGYKFSYGIAVSQIDGSVDGNGAVAHFLFALVFSPAKRVLVKRLKNPFAP